MIRINLFFPILLYLVFEYQQDILVKRSYAVLTASFVLLLVNNQGKNAVIEKIFVS